MADADTPKAAVGELAQNQQAMKVIMFFNVEGKSDEKFGSWGALMSQSVQVVERPILFSGEMVRAILEGRKTQTRRVIKPQPKVELFPFIGKDDQPTGEFAFVDHPRVISKHVLCPYGKPGDRLWVREKWKCAWTFRHGHGVLYAADDRFSCFNGCCNNLRNGKVSGGPSQPGYDWIAAHYGNDHRIEPWRPSIHMPRWASRLMLEIVKVRVERLQEISKADCIAEGMEGLEDVHAGWHQSYAQLWDSINSKRGFGWDKNPWVWAITFQRVRS